MAKLTQKTDLIASAIVYVAGTASLFLVDLLIAKVLDSDPELMADWAFLRSVVFIGAGLVIFGYEQAIIRSPMRAKTFLLPYVVQVTLLSLPLLFLPMLVPMSFSGVTVFVATASLATIMGVCGHFRSHLHVTLSQICGNGWKVVFGLAVMAFWWLGTSWEQIGLVLAACLIGSAAVCMLIGFLVRDVEASTSDENADVRYRELLPISYRFWLFALMANCVTHLDQILLNLTGSKIDASDFFTYRTIFLPAVLLAIGYVGVVVAPYIRRHPDKFREQVRYWLIGFILVGGALIAFSLVTGLSIGYWIGKFDDGVNWPLVVGFLCLGVMRYVYVLPSAMIGVYATRTELDCMLAASAIGVGMMVLVFFVMQRMGYAPIWSVIVGSLVNLFVRNTYGIWLSVNIFRSGRSVGSLT